MKILRYTLALIILVVLFIFSVYNAQLVRLSLFNYQTPQLPLFLVLIFAFCLGLLLAGLFHTLKGAQLRRQVGALQREADAARRSPQDDLQAGSEPKEAHPSGGA